MATTGVDPDEWLSAFDGGAQSSISGGGGGGCAGQQDPEEWLKQLDGQQQQRQTEGEGGGGSSGSGSGSLLLLQQQQKQRMYGTPSPPPLSAEESEAMRAKQEVLIQTNAELRGQLKAGNEREAFATQFMRDAFPIMQKALDDESNAFLKEWVDSNNHAMFYSVAAQWMQGVMEYQVMLLEMQAKDKAFMQQLEDDLKDAEADRDDALERLKRMRQKAGEVIEQEKEAGRLAYEKVMGEYEKLKTHAQALESDIAQMEARMAAGEKERERALAAATEATAAMTAALANQDGSSSLSGEVEQLKKDLEQAEVVFAELKKQNDTLEEERSKLAARLKWKEEAARRWDGEDSDNEEDVDQRLDPAGAILRAKNKKTRNKERSKRMTFAQYLESLQRENARNKADHLRSAQEAAALRAAVRTLRAANADLEAENATLRDRCIMQRGGVLLNIDKMISARDHAELTPTEVEAELLKKIEHLQADLHTLKWRFVAEQKAHAETRKQADAAGRQQVSSEAQKTATLERRLEEAKKTAAEREKALQQAHQQELESLKLANTRRTEAKNKELDEARAEIALLKKNRHAPSTAAAAAPAALPIEVRCGGIALQILSVVAGKFANSVPIIGEFHACVSAINKANLAPSSAPSDAAQHQMRVAHLYQQLYQCMSRTTVGNASLLQLYQAFDQASFSDESAAAAAAAAAAATPGKRSRPSAGEGEEPAAAVTTGGGASLRPPPDVELQRWQEFALALQPLLYIFVGFADFVSQGNTWRRDRPDMRPMFEHLSKVAECAKSLPPTFATSKALKDALGAPVVPAREGGGAAFVNVVESFARGCIAVNTTFAAETVKQLEDEKKRTAKMHEYNQSLLKNLEMTLANLMKGIEADPSNPLHANDHHMLVSMQTTLASVEADMRREATGQLPHFVENYVSSVKVAWQFLAKTLEAMHPVASRKKLRASQPNDDDDDGGEDVDYSGVTAAAVPSSPTYQF